jgi:hypothetical protein
MKPINTPSALLRSLFLFLSLMLVGSQSWAAADRSPASPEATVSGIVRHNGTPVAGVDVSVIWEGGGQTITTGSDGAYSAGSITTPAQIRIRVHPPFTLALAYESYNTALSSDLVHNFDLVAGYRLEGEIRTPGGLAYNGFSPSIRAIGMLPIESSFEDTAMDSSGVIDLYLRPGFYALGYNVEMDPYYLPPAIFDLRNGDVISQVVTLRYQSGPIPSDPPLASLISVGLPDAEGFADVTGTAGSVPPLAEVLVANLNAGSLDVTASDASGAFSANLFAPPGSSLLVKYDIYGDTLSLLWNSANIITYDVLGRAVGIVDFSSGDLPLLPGTMLAVGLPPAGGETWQGFESAGALVSSNPRGWAGLWLNGMIQTEPEGLPGLAVLPGETITLTANLHLSSPEITCTPPITFTVSASLFFHNQFGSDGRVNPGSEDFRSYLSTPTGLPINHPMIGESILAGYANLDVWTCAGEHSFQSSETITLNIPANLAEGIYVPELHWQADHVPLSAELPLLMPWYHQPPITFLPPITIGQPIPPRLPLVLFQDTPVNGHRGVQAIEDQGYFRMLNWVVFPPSQVVIPRLDERSGQPLVYSLEPASNWLSVTDRRIPNPLHIPLKLPSGNLVIEVVKPDGGVDTLGPAPIRQSSLRTPSTPGGNQIGKRSGTLGDVYQFRTMDEAFAYSFDQYGLHTIQISGEVSDIFGNSYLIQGTYEVVVARILDLDPAQLPTTPYVVGDAFAPGLHVYPQCPAQVNIKVVHMPYSDPSQAITYTVSGQANPFGYFQPPPGNEFRFQEPGEFRVDVSAMCIDEEGKQWAGFTTWGNVVEGLNPIMEAHGRRGMDYTSQTIDDMPAWFYAANLPPEKVNLDTYYPYFSGDIHWGGPLPLDSIQPSISVRDLTGSTYDILRAHVANSVNEFRNPPTRDPTLENLNKRAEVGEAPLFIATQDKKDPSLYPEAIQMLGYWYGTSERPGVHVREVISVDMLGVGYWGFDDNFTYQIGVPADGDQPGDIKWEFGGAVLRTITDTNPVNEYAIYSSLWVMLPDNDPIGGRITPPFQDSTGASVNGGAILTVAGQEIDMLFLPLGVRPGDVLQVNDTISFSGHVGPPLDSRVDVTITSPGGTTYSRSWHANKIGWLYDPSFDFPADEPGRWTVQVLVEHDRPYQPTGSTPTSHNSGTVLGSSGQYEFYVVEPGAPELYLRAPLPGYITWSDHEIEPVAIQGRAPFGTETVYYTIYDKGVVMGQGQIIPSAGGAFTLSYDANALHEDFSMLSLTAREGVWEGLADEVTISFLAVESGQSRAAMVTLIGEEVFLHTGISEPFSIQFLPLITK